MNLDASGKDARDAAHQLASMSTAQKNRALSAIADELILQQHQIVAANEKDIAAGKTAGLSVAMLDRLLLTPDRLATIVADIRKVITLEDPVGSVIDSRVLENGLRLSRRRVPIGVIAAIYEARPNVTIDIACLGIKTGNATILRGGSETIHSNIALIKVIQTALRASGLPAAGVQYIEDTDRAVVKALLRLDAYIDMIIPRGGPSLHQMCKEHSSIPVIIGGFGISHIFVDESADHTRAIEVVDNAKTDRPSACNALDTLLVHQAIAATFLPPFIALMNDRQVTLVGDENVMVYLNEANSARLATDADFDTEWLGLTLNIKLVADVSDALAHMRAHNATHSDAILTNDLTNSQRFINGAGSAAVYVNASTRFTDGGQFGLGAEVAVSTQMLHARGPMGLVELTSYKWVGEADYLIRT